MAIASSTLEALFNEREVARLTGLSVGTMRRRRLLRQPPPFLKLGSSVKYRPTDVAAWIESQSRSGQVETEECNV